MRTFRTRGTAVVLLALVAGLLGLPAARPAAGLPGVATAQVGSVVMPAVSTLGRPGRSYAIPAASYFSYPNRSYLEKVAIRNRVLYTIQSVYGGPRTSLGTPMPGNGKIRIATWSFDDWAIAKALVAARNRGVSVQVVAAAQANVDNAPWRYLRRHLGGYVYRPGHPETRETYTFARQCRGSCRGLGGTPHAKYFLFDNVGVRHVRSIVVNTSMNLTRFAYEGQWNQAQVLHNAAIWHDFMTVFRQARVGRPVDPTYHVAFIGNVADLFFPKPRTTYATDPVDVTLRSTYCTGALQGGTSTGRTRIRVVNYAIYGDRGVWLARRLRYLWGRGCDVAVIYSLITRPVLSILRSRSGRGPIPMRQSIIRNGAGEIVKYNHSKWMTITGRWGTSRQAYVTFSGSANWSSAAFGGDEQMQRIIGRRYAYPFLVSFAKTWRQSSSHYPGLTGAVADGRVLPGATASELAGGVTPAGDAPPFGQGIFRYMEAD